MSRKTLHRIALCAAVLALSLPGMPANAAEEVETKEVKVTATRTEKDLMEVPMSVGVVTSEDQKRRPQTSVAEMLADIPGVIVMDGGMPGGKRVQIRGESPMRTLILIDGVKISEQKSMSGSAILTDTSQIERIEVIKGPASVLYGSEAIGGVVNIITKKGGNKPIGFSQNFIYDSSNNGLDIQSAIFGSYEGFNYRFTASGVNAHDRWAGDGRIADSDYKNRNYTGRIGYDWDKGSVYLRADKYESEISIPSSVSSGTLEAFGTSPALMGGRNQTTVALDLPKWNRESVGAGVELRELTDFLAKVKLDAYYQNMEKKFNNEILVENYMSSGINFNRVNTFVQTINDQDSFGGTFQTEWTLGNHYVIAGVDYNKDKLDAKDNRKDSLISMGGSPWMVSTPAARYHYKVEQETLGAFIQDEWTFHEDWALTVGLRETWVRSKLKKNNNPSLEDNDDKSDSKLVGNAGIVYSGIKDVALRAMWSQGYRFPALNQLYLGTIHGSTNRTYPNPDLDPETSNSYEIGARISKPNWNVDIAAFYTYSKNYITTKPYDNGNANIFANIDKAKTFGVELAADYTFKPWNVTPYATATWLHREYENKVDLVTGERKSYETSLTDTPPFQGLVGVRWNKEILQNTTLFTDLYMHWAVKTKSYDYDSTYKGDFVTTQNHAWQTLNFTVGLEGGEEHKWHAALSLRNLLDKNYRQAGNGVDDPGFHVVATVGVEF
ncbi:MAG: Vitamin B12 transporter BtuB [Desulfovibrio sp.]